MDYRTADKTYRLTAGDDADTVVIGNALNHDRVDAHVACRRWGGEVEFLIEQVGRYESSEMRDGGKALFRGADDEVRIYQRPDGQIEIETTLLRRPAVSEWVYKIGGHKDLEFLYQPELTAQELADGHQRPDDVIGSYAVYHRTRSNHVLGQTNYRGGKLFQIYRPLAIDARGERQWGTLAIDPAGGTLKISFDPAWLAAAAVPIVFDPNLGYDVVGASFYNSSARFWLQNYLTTAGSDGTASKLWIYTHTNSDPVKLGLYNGTAGGNLLTGTGSGTYELTSPVPTSQWNPVDCSGDAITVTSSNGYHVAATWEASGHGCKFDTGGGGSDLRYTNNPTAYASQLVAISEDNSEAGFRASIYLEYTEAGGGSDIAVLRRRMEAA